MKMLETLEIPLSQMDLDELTLITESPSKSRKNSQLLPPPMQRPMQRTPPVFVLKAVDL